MRVVIIGAGDVGTRIARDLADAHDLVVVDGDPARIESLGVATVEGDGRLLNVLETAGIREADIVIAATGNDATNVMVCGATANLTDAFTIARVKSTDLSETWREMEDVFGIDLLVNVDSLTAEAIARTLALPGALTAETFADGLVMMAEFEITAEDSLADQRVADADQFPSLTFAGLLRGNEVMIPSGETVIEPGDRVVVIGSLSGVRRFATRFSAATALEPDDAVVVIGGGEVGCRTAHLFEEQGYAPRLIEHDPERADELTTRLPETTIIEGEATSFDLLADHLDGADAVISTLDDETNYLVSLLADRLGTGRTVAVVDEREYIDLFEVAGVDVTVNPHTVIAGEIVRMTREFTDDAAVLENDSAEVVELTVERDSVLAGESLGDVARNLPEGFVVGAVIRGGSLTTPRGGTVIQTGDSVVAFVDTAAVEEVASIL